MDVASEPADVVDRGQGAFKIAACGCLGMMVPAGDAVIPSPAILFKERLHERRRWGLRLVEQSARHKPSSERQQPNDRLSDNKRLIPIGENGRPASRAV